MENDFKKRENEDLLRLAYKDPLTGAFNRPYVEAKLKEEVRRARRDKGTFSLLMIDIDHFKLYNDTLGHHWGDRLLGRVGEVLSSQIGEMDTLARYGGDEFIIILPGKDLIASARYAKELLKTISKSTYPGQELFKELYPEGRLTASIGVTAFHSMAEQESDIIAWADYALYRAKRLGRNRVIPQEGPPHIPDGRQKPLQLFSSLSDVFSKEISFDDKLQKTVDLVRQWLSVDVCSLYLLQENELVLRATVGLNRAAVGHVHMKTGEGLTGLAAETLTTVCIRDAAKHPRYKYFPETGEEQFGSYLGVPILYEWNPLGVIVVQTKAIQDFTEEEVMVVKTIGGFLGGYLQSAVRS